MGRPVKWRRVNQLPTILQFVPSDNRTEPASSNQAGNTLLVEEFEAIRLKDLEGLEQGACAEQMQISRPTFQRILLTAHQKVADSLIYGKGIRIEGGTYTHHVCPVRCLDCGLVWTESVEVLTSAQSDYTCPRCRSTRIVCAPAGPLAGGAGARNRLCQRGCWRNGWSSKLTQEESEGEKDGDHHDTD